ncbi:MAG: c-type cytochrome [Terracidiphilus sp.]
MRTFIFGLVVGGLVLPIVAAGVFLLGWSSVEATSDPPRWETALARRAFAASVARQAPEVQNPIPVNSDTLRAGMKFYRDGCAGCHGDAGKPSQWGTRDFYPRVPQFDSEPPVKPDWQLFWIAKHGVRYSGMGGWDSLTSDENLWKTVAFLNHLKSLPPDVEAEWRGQKSK